MRFSAFLPCLVLLTLLLATHAPAGPEEPLVLLARQAVRAEVEGRQAPVPESRSPACPVFVTIERAGRVIGCRGSLEARRPSLEEEIVGAARAAAAHDPRYRPLSRRDLEEFVVTVTLVRRLEAIEGVDALSPGDGLVLKAGGRTGVVLPRGPAAER